MVLVMANSLYKITKKFSVLLNFDITSNNATGGASDVATTFSYLRYNIMGGVSYSF